MCALLTSLYDASTLPSYASISQKPPLTLQPHLTLQVVLLGDLRDCMKEKTKREKKRFTTALPTWNISTTISKQTNKKFRGTISNYCRNKSIFIEP